MRTIAICAVAALVSGCQPNVGTSESDIEVEVRDLRDELDSLKRSHEITARLAESAVDRTEEVAEESLRNHATAMGEIASLSSDIQNVESRVGY